jgi:hypothetical protein
MPQSSFVPSPPTTAVRVTSATFPVVDTLLQDIGTFTERVLTDWELDRLAFVAASTVVELAVWLQNHQPSPAVRLGLSWTPPLVGLELLDQGPRVPHTGVSALDAALAMRLLIQPGVQWGASLDARGRCLWATVAAGAYDDPAPAHTPGAGP